MGSVNILEKINLELQREVRLLKSTSKKTDPVALLGPHQTALNRIIREGRINKNEKLKTIRIFVHFKKLNL